MSDCVFEPKNVVAASVGMVKNEESHKFDAHVGGNENFNDTIYNAAYGRNNLGMPLLGKKSNVSSLSANTIQKFQSLNITPKKVVICASGIENHQEFVDLVNEKMYLTLLPTK